MPRAPKRNRDGDPVVAPVAAPVQTLVTRLEEEFGQLVNTVAGKSPDATRHLPELICKIFTRRKYQNTPKLRCNTRVRVVTVGLQKLVKPSFTGTEVLVNVADYVSKLRVNANLFANWIQLKKLTDGQPVYNVYDTSNNIFTKVLSSCYGRSTGSEFKVLFTAFSTATGVQLLPLPEVNINQVLIYEATEMKTAASTMDELQYTKRLQSIVKYVLHRTIGSLPGVREKVFCRRIHDLAVLIISGATAEQVNAKISTCGFIPWSEQLQGLCTLLRTQTPDATSKQAYPARVRFLWQLQRDYTETDRETFNRHVADACNQFPDAARSGSERTEEQRKVFNKAQGKKRSSYIKKHWPHRTPPKTTLPLPLCDRKAAFIRVDQKAIGQMFPEYRESCKGAWWYQAFMRPHSREANVTTLRQHQNSFGSSEYGVFQALRTATERQCPWLVGSTFQTNGIECKLDLVTSSNDNPGKPGFWAINKKGWKSVSTKQTPLTEVFEAEAGVYQCHHINARDYASSSLDDVEVIGIDPGQVKVISALRCKMSEAAHENVVALMNDETRNHFEYSGEEYQVKSRAKLAAEGEVKRRTINADYRSALELLSVRKKTGVLTVLEQYCRVWQQCQEVVWKEKLSHHRKHQRFNRFRAVQQTIAKIAELVSPMRDKGVKRRLVFWGTGSLTACRGACGAPTKKVVRELAQRVPTLMTLEAYSTCKCPGCRRETRGGDDYRTRTCETLPSDHGGCPLHPTTDSWSYDRDKGGETNIIITGVAQVKAGTGIAPTFASLQPRGFEA
jgi:hypothetical protein